MLLKTWCRTCSLLASLVAALLAVPLGLVAQEPGWEFAVTGSVQRLWLSPEGRFVAVAHTRGADLSRLEEGSTRVVQYSLDPGSVTDLAFSPDGRWLLAVYGGRELHLYDLITHRGAFLPLVEAPEGLAERVAFSPDSETIVVLHREPWGAAALSLEGDLLASARFSGASESATAAALAVSNNGRWVFASIAGTLFEWQFQDVDMDTDLLGEGIGFGYDIRQILPYGADGWLAVDTAWSWSTERCIRRGPGEPVIRDTISGLQDLAVRGEALCWIRTEGSGATYTCGDVSWARAFPGGLTASALSGDGLSVAVAYGQTVYVRRAPVYTTVPRLRWDPIDPACGDEVRVTPVRGFEGLTLSPESFRAERVGDQRREVRVTDARGWQLSVPVQVHVVVSSCPGLVAGFTWEPTGLAPGQLKFTNASETRPGNGILRSFWYAEASLEQFATESSAVFTFPGPGMYAVQLFVFDSLFNKAEFGALVEVSFDDPEEVSP